MDELLEKFKRDCDEMVIRARRDKQINEEFRYKMLNVINGLNALVPELLNQVNALIEGIKDSTISAIAMEQRLKELNVAANIITTRTQAVQSSMPHDEMALRRGEFDECTLLYSMFNTTNNIVAELINMTGSLTVEYANSILQEKALSDQLKQAEQR